MRILFYIESAMIGKDFSFYMNLPCRINSDDFFSSTFFPFQNMKNLTNNQKATLFQNDFKVDYCYFKKDEDGIYQFVSLQFDI